MFNHLFKVSCFRFYFRLYIYPIKVLYSCGYVSMHVLPKAPFYFFFNAMLWVLFFMNIWWFHFIVWLIIRIVVGKSHGVEDTREIPRKLEKEDAPGKVANIGKGLQNGERHMSVNHGKTRHERVFEKNYAM